jgi:hypothetical protein
VFVYILSVEGSDSIKVGKANDVERRLSDLQIGCPLKLKIMKTFDCSTATRALVIEKIGHDLLRLHAQRGEWFRYPGDEAMAQIMSILAACASGRQDVNDTGLWKIAKGAIRASQSRMPGRRRTARKFGFTKDQMKAVGR